MTLSEIETTLTELTVRHKNLDITLLSTLLTSGGWDEKTIKEAVLLYTQKEKLKDTPQEKLQEITKESTSTLKAVVPPPIEQNPIATKDSIEPVSSPIVIPGEVITFYQPDGSEEGELHTFADTKIEKKEESQINVVSVAVETPHIVTQEIKTEYVPLHKDEEIKMLASSASQAGHDYEPVASSAGNQLVAVPLPMSDKKALLHTIKEPESLISHTDSLERKEQKDSHVIPENLPLLPFESSPHIWSFSKYKNIFYKEDIPKEQIREEIQVITVMPQERIVSEAIFSKPLQDKTSIKSGIVDEEVVIKKIPYTKEDQSLVFLAGMMLLAIILILGYMYSNGRL